MSDDALVFVCVTAGTGLGAMVGSALPGARPETIVFFAAAGSAAGAIAGSVTSMIRTASRCPSRSRERPKNDVATLRHRQSPKIIPVRKPGTEPELQKLTPFRKRLAKFTHQNESEVMDDSVGHDSKMRFWSLASIVSLVPPKSARLIRQCLLSIRRAAGRDRA
ncbi:hypothetical protein CA13_00070 [Planctomycetes bacterium CA13]|uniref:Uncharacterized protein n=1 Tax=Novipirellula herctigrandis TaxID=2527986 RepID=A0A5C5YUX1_9BACT|nr:hypothetical protein CA13_00070 [Planctomycetes bacterium CA13]